MPIGIVSTKYGNVKGVELEGKYSEITLFKGIPYAAPPVGRLRWAPPEDPEAWEGVRVCDEYGAAPVQMFYDGSEAAMATAREYHFMEDPDMSEDCLYLNVYTPASSSEEKLPVYIWYHGGGLVNGYAYEVEFDPCEMVKKGIIVVQVEQRLNVFGFLALPQLTAEGGTSGNYGLMDQIKALDWICENIAAFGGDSVNITAGGESAGSTKASVVASIPAGKGRIKRVINQSGNMWLRELKTMAEEEKIGIEYLKHAGFDPNMSVEELRSIDPLALFTGKVPREWTPNDMVIDGKLISCSFRELFRNLDGVDFLNGSNFGESEVFGKPWWEFRKTIDTTKEFYEYFKYLLGGLYDKYDFKKLIKVTDKNAWYTARRLAALGLCPASGNTSRNLMLNRIFGMYMAKRHPNIKVYSYIWSHFPPYLPEDIGTACDPQRLLAFHSCELWFVFASLREGIPPCRPWRESDYRFADKICSYWANFIRCGNPNGDDLPYWPPSSNNYGYIDLDEDIKSGDGISGALDSLLYEFVCAEYDVSC